MMTPRQKRVAEAMAIAAKQRKSPWAPVVSSLILTGATICAYKATRIIGQAYDTFVPMLQEKILSAKIAAETYAELRQEAEDDD